MCESANLAVGACGVHKIQVGISVGLARAGFDAELLQHCFPDQVRSATARVGDADIDVGLPEMARKQLRMTIGHVHQRDVALRFSQVVETRAMRRSISAARKGQALRGSDGQQLQELPAGQIHCGSL